ncbi:MAG: hypothetical protein LBQ75_00495 [Zoogloeaceae bacterium]|jgi:chromosome segregation ATPase|nr:hypothetical protein [Zoogloeaceae bacterium]
MEKTLDALAGKIEQVVLLTESLQGDKAALESRLKQTEEERDRLKKNMEQARERIVRLMMQLPEQIK